MEYLSIYIYIWSWWFQSLWKNISQLGLLFPTEWNVIIHSCSLNHQPDIVVHHDFPWFFPCFYGFPHGFPNWKTRKDWTGRSGSIRWASGDFHRMFLQGFVQGRSKDGQGQSKRGSHLERCSAEPRSFLLMDHGPMENLVGGWLQPLWKIWKLVSWDD